jgi:hypothetical protein
MYGMCWCKYVETRARLAMSSNEGHDANEHIIITCVAGQNTTGEGPCGDA